METLKLAEEYENYIVDQYHWFHQHPELSWEEAGTTERIEQELKEMGLQPKRFPGHTGLIAEIRGGKATNDSKTVILRADIDALPIEEHTGLPYTSENPGVMHACGHDTHIAMLLGAAKILMAQKEDLPGTVRLFFQAAEETCHGAEYYIQQGVLDGADAIYASHIWRMNEPYVDVSEGPRMASCDNFTITVQGKATHATSPQLGEDAIVAAAAIILSLQTLTSRRNDPMNPTVMTIGEIHGGQRFNILADHVEMKGTVRTFDQDFRKTIEEKMQGIVEHTAKAYGAAAEIAYQYYPPSLNNNQEDLNNIAHHAAEKIYGAERIKKNRASMGSEDFAYYMDVIPGFYGLIGGLNPEKGFVYGNHSDKFAIDESALKRGAALYAQFAADFLSYYSCCVSK